MNKKYALITGASSGIGEEIARNLASKGFNLVITARRLERLNNLSKDICSQYDVDVRVLLSDLSEESAVNKIYEFCNENGLNVDMIVNNAGYTSLTALGSQWHTVAARVRGRPWSPVAVVASSHPWPWPLMAARRPPVAACSGHRP